MTENDSRVKTSKVKVIGNKVNRIGIGMAMEELEFKGCTKRDKHRDGMIRHVVTVVDTGLMRIGIPVKGIGTGLYCKCT